MLVERHQLAVEHGLVSDGGERGTDRRVFPRDVVAVAGIERGVPGPGHGDGAEPIPLRLEHPIRIVERLVGERGEHGPKIGLHHRTVLPRDCPCGVARTLTQPEGANDGPKNECQYTYRLMLASA